MNIGIDPDDPKPLYLQIAEAIRTRIQRGEIGPGDQLAPLRRAAQVWGVNLHTVRHAYAALAREGLVETARARHTRVVASAIDAEPSGRVASEPLSRFIDRTLNRARRQFGLDRQGLIDELVRLEPHATETRPRVHVVECSEGECVQHARELQDVWHVDARPWSLERNGEPPEGLIVATYFHYNDIRRRWPHRLRGVRFLTIGPDPSLVERLPRPRESNGPVRLVVCEFDEPTAEAITADLSVLLPTPAYEVRTAVDADHRALLGHTGEGECALFPPRVWARLDESDRADTRAFEARYVFDPGELDAIGGEYGWRRAGSVTPSFHEPGDPTDDAAPRHRALVDRARGARRD